MFGDEFKCYFGAAQYNKLNCPLSLQLEITDACPNKCKFCYRPQNPTFMNFDVIKKLTEDLELNNAVCLRFTGGEPLIHPNFSEISSLKNKMLFTITTSLAIKQGNQYNKVLDSLKNFNSIKISISAGNKENYRKIHGSNYFNDVVSNIEYLNKKLKKKVSINFVVTDETIEAGNLVDFIRMINTLKITGVTFFPALSTPMKMEFLKEFKNLEKIVSGLNCRSNFKNLRYHLRERKKEHTVPCYISLFHVHIKTNGDVYPCCMSGGEIGQKLSQTLKMGNINEESISEIYKKNKNITKNLGMKIYNFDFCKECTGRYKRINLIYDDFSNNKLKFEI